MAADSSAKYTGPTLVPTGQYAGQPGIALRRPVYVIGSRSDARIHLQSSTVSRAHAILVQTRHETYIRDLASRGGVFVNGKQVRETALKNGDLIGIGKFTFQYQANHISHGAEPPAHPAALQVSGADFPIPIEGRVVLIGRRSGCDIQLTEEAASSSHAVILQWEGLRFIRDLGSRTGTFVNGNAIHEVQLNPNDAIRIGETDITYSPSLEEAAFDLISDASDSMIADHPVAEEVNVSPHAEPVGTPAAPIVPHLPIAEIELDPIAHEPPPVEEVAAKAEPVKVEAAAELPPLPLEVEPSEAAPEETVEPLAEEDVVAAVTPTSSSESIPLENVVDANEPESHDHDLVTLATDDAEPLPLEPTPHDTAHIPLAVNQAEPPIEAAAEVPAQNAVVDASLQAPVGSIDMAGGAEPLSAEQLPPSENFSEPIPLAETPHAENPIAETEAVGAEPPSAMTDESAMVESDGLELLDESGIPPFTPVSPEPLAADLSDEADLPRRGWRSGIVEPTAPPEIENESVAEPEAKIEPPVAEEKVSELEIAQPEIAQPEIAEPELTEAETALFEETVPQDSKPEIVELELTVPESAEPQTTDDLLQFADEQTLIQEPTADHDAVIDVSALFSNEVFPESTQVHGSEPVEEPIADLGVADLGVVAESNEPATAEPFDLSSVDFTEPSKTIADLANEAPVIQAAPIETPVGTPIETSIEGPSNVADEVAAEIPEVNSAVESSSAAIVDDLPLEVIPDEFIPSGEVSADDFPVDDSESLSSFKIRRQEVRDKAARSRRPLTEKIQPIANETIEPTEPTPQSALDLPIIEPAISEIPTAAMMGGAALPLVDLAADLSDTTFGRAVQEFEGESTGPIVEESAHEEHETAAVEPNITIPSSNESAPVEINRDLLEAAEPAAEIAPVAFAESETETVAPNFRSENPDTPEIAEAEITDAESVDVPAAHVPLFDANTIEDSIPSDLGHAPHPTVQRPLELPKSDFVGVDNTYVIPEDSSENAPPPKSSNSLDLSKLELEAESSQALDESVISDLLSEPPMHEGQATTDLSSELPPPSVVKSDVTLEPHPAEVHPVEALPVEPLPIESHPAEPIPADIEIVSAQMDGSGANQTHYLGGEPLNLKDGVHPPAGFGEVGVDFSQPPMVHADAPVVLKDEVAPPYQHQPSALPADHDILPPEAGDAMIPSAPAALASLTTLAAEVAAVGIAADPFLIDRAMSKVEIPAFGLAGTPQPTPTQEKEPPVISSDSDAPLRSIGKSKGRRSRVIRNGFGQNPDAPKAEPREASPFADSAAGLSGMAMDSIAAPAIPDVDVFSELPSRSEKSKNQEVADQPFGTSDVGHDLTADAWTKTSPLPGRSRRRSTAIPFVPPVVTTEFGGAAASAMGSMGGLAGIAPEYLQPRPAILLEDENRANAAAVRRSKLLKRVPILCATMVALIGVAITICALFIPVRQQVQATMSYRNFDHLTHEEQLHFQADQERKLHLDGTRMLAITKLQNRHPQATPGFLNSPEQFASLQLDWPESRAGEPGIAWINYQSSDTNIDPARVQAVAMAMFDVNSDLATAAQAVKQSMDQLNSDIAADGRQIDELTNKINAERAFLDGRPTLAELAKLKDDDATLEAAYKDAMDKAMSAQAAVDQLNKEHAAETKPVAPGTDPVAADAQIQQMSKDADALNTRIAAARKERADLAAKARETLDSAYDQFKKQVQDSQNVTKDNPQLAAYVTAAQNLQQAIHQLTDEYIQKQQDEYKQLKQMKDSVVAKIQQRQADLFADDSQLKELNDQKEILTRKYNEAINSGLDKDASDLKNELALNDNLTKARKELISNDQVYNELLSDLQQIIDQKQHDIDAQRKNTDEQLATMKDAFNKSAPTVEQLPAEQKQLASAMQDKLAQIDAARKQYAEAADASAGDTDSSIQGMVNDLQTLQTNLETRKRQVAAANSEAAIKARDDQFNADLSQKTTVLDQLNKTAATAQAAYQVNHAKLLQRESVADQTGASAQRLEQDINNQQALRAQLEQHKMAWDQKNNEFQSAVEPLEPEMQAHLVGSPIDNRVLYAGISSGSIVVLFLIAICWTVISAARESHHAYVPAIESLETPGHPNGNGNGMQGEEAEEERAAVA